MAREQEMTVCLTCATQRLLEGHHPGREDVMPTVIVPECRTHHRMLTRLQARWGAWRDGAPRSDSEAFWIAFRGILDALDSAGGLDPDLDERIGAFADGLRHVADVAFGFVFAAEDPEREWGTDPILTTPRAYKGRRPAPRAEGRERPPTSEHDLARVSAIVRLVADVDRHLHGDDAVLKDLDPDRFATRWTQLVDDLSFDPFETALAEATRVLNVVGRVRSVDGFIRVASRCAPIVAYAQLVERLVVEVGQAEDEGEAREALDAFYAAARRLPVVRDTDARNESVPRSRGGQGLLDEDRGR
jgi:hypothetical protein